MPVCRKINRAKLVIGQTNKLCDNQARSYFKDIMKANKIALYLLSSMVFGTVCADVTTHFNQIKNDPNALYAFFKKMPKGGELHYHLAGGPYPETMLALAATGDYCLDTSSYTITKNQTECKGIESKEINNQPALYSEVVKDWSMKNFIPGNESGHDHFFNSFMKYMPIVFDFRPQLLVDVIQRAAEQNELYLEIMAIPDNANSAGFGSLLGNKQTFDQKRKTLLENKEFQANIENTIIESNTILATTHKELECTKQPESKACRLNVKFLYYVLREQPIDNVFAQALNAFEVVSRSKGSFVGVNLVQPEDGIIALRDYRKHMKIFEYLHHQYPTVAITLHAGELAPEAVEPEELGYHIHDAIFTGKAQRIGHGVDIGYETHSKQILDHMAKQGIPVEINLISNEKILNISGKQHPLNYYLKHQVPVVLSTDDEGVLRTDLTRQYVEAVLGHSLDYPTIKQINRNALTYSFLPGKSIWASPQKGELVSECKDPNSNSCLALIKNSEKATMQWMLEKELVKFEQEW